jgi:nitrogenase subunit NifH
VTLRIAVAGKGGVGKTTCSALLLRALALSGVRPLLAVDADPNANLHQLLSLPLPEGLGSLREEQRAAAGGTVPLMDRIAFGIERRVSEGEAAPPSPVHGLDGSRPGVVRHADAPFGVYLPCRHQRGFAEEVKKVYDGRE